MDNEEMQISEVDKKMLKKAINFEDKGDFAMYEEVSEIKDHLEGIHENLKLIAEKPEMEMPEIPEPKEIEFPEVQKVEVMNQMKMPEMPKTDLTKTNNLLQQLVDKEDEPLNVNVKLNLV